MEQKGKRAGVSVVLCLAVIVGLILVWIIWYIAFGKEMKIRRDLEDVYGERFIVIDHYMRWMTYVDIPPSFRTFAICAPESDPEMVFRFELGYRDNGWRYYYALAERALTPLMEEKAEAYFGDCTVTADLIFKSGEPHSKEETTTEQLLLTAAEAREKGRPIYVDYTLFVNTDSYQGTNYSEEFQELTRMRAEIKELGLGCDLYVYFMPEETINEYIRIQQYSRDVSEELAPIQAQYEEIPFSDYQSALQTEENYISMRSGE